MLQICSTGHFSRLSADFQLKTRPRCEMYYEVKENLSVFSSPHLFQQHSVPLLQTNVTKSPKFRMQNFTNLYIDNLNKTGNNIAAHLVHLFPKK